MYDQRVNFIHVYDTRKFHSCKTHKLRMHIHMYADRNVGNVLHIQLRVLYLTLKQFLQIYKC